MVFSSSLQLLNSIEWVRQLGSRLEPLVLEDDLEPSFDCSPLGKARSSSKGLSQSLCLATLWAFFRGNGP